MLRIAIIAVLTLLGAPALGCEIDQVANDIYFTALQRAAELAKQQTFLLGKFRAISDRAKDPNKPLNQQLSQADLAEFTQTQTRFQSIELL